MPRGVLVAIIVQIAGCDESAQSQRIDLAGSLVASTNTCNLLLLTLDTTRADRLGCYGYRRAHTPHLDAVAASGVRFEQAYAHVPITLPSHACLLTGTQPPENGVRGNGSYRLGLELTTLAELLNQLKIQPRYVAVERNLDLVPRSMHATCVLQPGDRLEVVTLVGGG